MCVQTEFGVYYHSNDRANEELEKVYSIHAVLKRGPFKVPKMRCNGVTSIDKVVKSK